MTVRAFMQRLAAKIACLLVFVLAVSACDRDTPLLAVKAVAAGVPSLAPFFDERSGLGKDAQDVASQPVRGSLQQGDTPGLYGGSKQPPSVTSTDSRHSSPIPGMTRRRGPGRVRWESPPLRYRNTWIGSLLFCCVTTLS